MYEDVVFVNYTPDSSVLTTATVRVRPLGRAYHWHDYGRMQESGFVLGYEGEDGRIHVQEVNRFGTRTFYHYFEFPSLGAALNGGFGEELAAVLGIE